MNQLKCYKLFFVTFGILAAILLRTCTSLHPYSGQHKPPMFGDFEAQRHWMEITSSLPLKQWYSNSTENDLQYWGLDYPPLTAYHSFICGFIAKLINPNYVELHTSRGLESSSLKLFMRYTVLVADLLIYIPALCFYFYVISRPDNECIEEKQKKSTFKNKTHITDEAKVTEIPKKIKSSMKTTLFEPEDIHKRKAMLDIDNRKTIKNVTFSKNLVSETNHAIEKKHLPTEHALILSLLYPGIILIDHGHFQYNCVSLGFAVFSVTFLRMKRYLSASLFFSLALNYKQMELYHALPFFFYLLSTCIPRKRNKLKESVAQLFKIGSTVILTFAIIWLPFLTNTETTIQVFNRLFPLDRGVFEDKVANFWCALNVFYKLKNIFTNTDMAKICLFTTLLSILPCNLDLFLRPNIKKFILALINCSLGFFLFSFQVHEKSILLVAIPVLLYFPEKPSVCYWFLIISTFSMTPLLVKDNLRIAYTALSVFFSMSYYLMMRSLNASAFSVKQKKSEKNSFFKDLLITLLLLEDGYANPVDVVKISTKHLSENKRLIKRVFFLLVFIESIIGCFALLLLMTVFEPPAKYPDLFPLLISIYSFIHFFAFFIYFNTKQFQIPGDNVSSDEYSTKKLKQS